MISKWVRGKLLGQGTYGRVYLATDTSTGELFAVKQVDRKALAQRRNLLLELKKEREILSGLDHPHIIAYLGTEQTATFLSLYVVCSLDEVTLTRRWQILGIRPWRVYHELFERA